MTSPALGRRVAAGSPLGWLLTGCSQLSSCLPPQLPVFGALTGHHPPIPQSDKLRLRGVKLTGPRSHRLRPVSKAGSALAPAHPRPGSSAGRTGASSRSPLPASAVRGERASSGDAGLGAQGCSRGRGRAGTREGDPRLRSPRAARLLRSRHLQTFRPAHRQPQTCRCGARSALSRAAGAPALAAAATCPTPPCSPLRPGEAWVSSRPGPPPTPPPSGVPSSPSRRHLPHRGGRELI